MKPRFANTRGGDVETLRADVEELADDMGEGAGGVLLGAIAIGTTETRVPHGQRFAPRWRAYDVPYGAVFGQTRAADARYLYLQADADVTVGIEVF